MQRLIYSPKAFVYIMSDVPPPDITADDVLSRKSLAGTSATGGPFLHNISDLVVSGTVTRRIDQVSSAEVVFRNPKRMYTNPGNPVFRPMDAITIFLQRLPGCPIQTFTGYLDETPYYQMYPGTATLTASCTLKRLEFKYFDPGLPFMMAFLAKYGWAIDPNSNGAITNKTKNGKGQTKDQIQDANLSELIYEVMLHIGEWQAEALHVEKLPPRLINNLSKIYDAISQENEEVTGEFEEFLKDFVGSGGSDPTSGGGTSAEGGPEEYRKFANEAADKYGVDAAVLMGICDVESQFGTLAGSKKGGTSSAGALGPMQFMPATWQQYGVDANGDGTADVYDPKDAMYAAAKYLAAAGFKQDVRKAIFAYNHADWYVNLVLSKADKYRPKDSSNTKSDPSDAHRADPDSDQTKYAHRKGDSTDSSAAIIAPIAKQGTFGRGWHETSKGVPGWTYTSGHKHMHSGVDYGVDTGTPCVAPASGEITMAQSAWSDGGMVHFKFTEKTGNIDAGTIIGWGHVTDIKVKVGDKVKGGDLLALSGNPGGGPHVHFVLITNGEGGGGDGDTDPVPILTALQKGETVVVDATNSQANGGASGGDALQAAKAAGLLTTFQFPAAFDQAESLLLRGDKSLMNDQPLLPFIEELCRGSLRNFMSLPNGDFYAFHPDYFGGFGSTPTWWIDDIEVIEGNIQLTDANLATHVYVVGATLADQNIEISRKLNTTGVVNVFNAGTADFLNNDSNTENVDKPKDKKGKTDTRQPFLGSMKNTLDFLNRYGARPFVQEQPMIRSHIFETFYAFQTFLMMWSRQFLTPFQFTFMPELYPAMHVIFKSHGIQCYVEEVHHSWDYSSGFTTTANLSSPSATDNRKVSAGMVRSGVTGSADEELPTPTKPSYDVKTGPFGLPILSVNNNISE
jgi:murein DD-endopeptidase MepM/ murein hydrolase activator NlpD